ncbi:oxidoreductase-like domain-containing 1 [Brachionus plicatilis]|uniref:Oxidoreductase-like domain-containing 1 n=1 Tax=Brachionus plicatilis TaxID=10195 RepID=A0A3M7S0Q2_BRAPC|nr:oxidoreductase-like domain-containing 1 [Brachionus plicatilis]
MDCFVFDQTEYEGKKSFQVWALLLESLPRVYNPTDVVMLTNLINYSARKLIHRKFGTTLNFSSSKHRSNVKPPPQIPLMCCGSGCNNCIWIQYAEELVKYYESRGEKKEKALRDALVEIQKIEDKRFLLSRSGFQLIGWVSSVFKISKNN